MASEPRTSSDAAASGPTAAVARPDFGDRLAQRVRPRQRLGRQALGRAAGDVVRRSVEFATSVGVSATGRWTLARHRAGDRRSAAGASADRLLALVDERGGRRRDRHRRRAHRRSAARPTQRACVATSTAARTRRAQRRRRGSAEAPAVAADTARAATGAAAAGDRRRASWGTSKLDELARRLGVGAPVEVDATPPPDARDAAGATRPVADASGRRAGRGAAATAGSPARRGLPLTAASARRDRGRAGDEPGRHRQRPACRARRQPALAGGERAARDRPGRAAHGEGRVGDRAGRPAGPATGSSGSPGSPPAPSGSGPPPAPAAPGRERCRADGCRRLRQPGAAARR